jgi:hypothetical protein
VAHMGEGRRVHRVLVGKPEGRRTLGRSRRRWEDNIKMDLQALIHTCHAVPLPCSDSAVSFVKVRVVAGHIRTASATV